MVVLFLQNLMISDRWEEMNVSAFYADGNDQTGGHGSHRSRRFLERIFGRLAQACQVLMVVIRGGCIVLPPPKMHVEFPIPALIQTRWPRDGTR